MDAGVSGSSSGISSRRARIRSMPLLRTTRINHVFIWSGSCTEANLTQAVRNDGTAPGSVDSKG